MNDPVELIVPIVLFAAVFGIVYIALSARKQERMALIEKGADASLFYAGKKPKSGKWLLYVGMIAVGIALGTLIGSGLEAAGLDEDVAYPAAIFFFGGSAMILAYFLGRKINGDKESQ